MAASMGATKDLTRLPQVPRDYYYDGALQQPQYATGRLPPDHPDLNKKSSFAHDYIDDPAKMPGHGCKYGHTSYSSMTYTHKYYSYFRSGVIDSNHEHFENRKLITDLLYDKLFWICATPCTCSGMGCVRPNVSPLGLLNCKVACYNNLLQTDGCLSDMGMCLDLRKTFCFVTHCACPPGAGPGRTRRGMPFCAILDYRCCDDPMTINHGVYGAALEDVQLLNKTFLCLYCWCLGFGFTECHDPWCSGLTKCLCCRDHCYTESACPQDGDCCFHHEKCCCCVFAHTYPSCGGEKDGIPACNCCNYTFCGPPVPKSEGYCFGAPKQVNMVYSPRSPGVYQTGAGPEHSFRSPRLDATYCAPSSARRSPRRGLTAGAPPAPA